MQMFRRRRPDWSVLDIPVDKLSGGRDARGLDHAFDKLKASLLILAVEDGELTGSQTIRILCGEAWMEATGVAHAVKRNPGVARVFQVGPEDDVPA